MTAKLFNDAGFERHVLKSSQELIRIVRSGKVAVLGDYRRREPDLFARDSVGGPNLELIDVKTLTEGSRRLSIQQPQFDYNATEYEMLKYAIWADQGRIALTRDELLDRQIEWRGGGKVHPGRNGAPPYYLFDVSTDEFVDPFYDPQRRRRTRKPDADMQLGLDGRATFTTRSNLGPVQTFVLERLGIAPLKAWQIGVMIHSVRMRCNDAPSRRHLTRPLRSGECCYGAVDTGGAMIKPLRDRGLIWKDEAGYWHLYEEEEWSYESA